MREAGLPAHTIVGAQWGDEGKGKLVDYIAPNYDHIVRFQGGNNAGHTVKVADKTYKFHLLPSGAVRGRPIVIGNGVVVDPRVLVKEIDELQEDGRRLKLLISDRAHVILPWHVLLDGAAEAGPGRKIGTTKRGIGPCYADKASRLGIRMGQFVDVGRFRQRLEEVYPAKERDMEAAGVKDIPTPQQVLGEYEPLARRLAAYVGDAGQALDAALKKGKSVLFEGAQGILLDIDHGTYPYVTSSNTISGNAAGGSGIGPHHLGPVLGVAKAYVTRVGEGPFPTEISTGDGIGKQILTIGREFGTTTGRPRRVGWMDLVALRYAVRVAGISHLAITKLDVLNGVNQIKACTGYERNGRKMTSFPADIDDLADAKPVYRSFPGWLEAGIKKGSKWTLALEAKSYLKFLEKAVGVPIVVGSVGPERTETLVLAKNPFM